MVSNGDFETGEIGSTNLVTYSEPTGSLFAGGITYETKSWDNGLSNGVHFSDVPDGISPQYTYVGTGIVGEYSTFSFFIEMDDGSEPVIGGPTQVDADFGVMVKSQFVTGSNIVKENVIGNIWRIKVTSLASGLSLSGNIGILKYQNNTNKGFSVTGYQIEQLPYATSYIPTNGSIQSRVNTTGWSTLNAILKDGSVTIGIPSGGISQFGTGNILESDKTYSLSYEVIEDNGGVFSLATPNIDLETTVGVHTLNFTATGADVYIKRAFGTTIPSTFDNISVKEVLGQEVASSGCPSLLLEPQSTNLLPYSEDFSQWAYISNAVSESNVATAPDGSNNASRITFDGTTRGRVEYSSIGGLNIGSSYTFSVWLKTESGTLDVEIGHSNWGLKLVTVTDAWQRFTQTITSTTNSAYPRVRCDNAGSVLVWGYQQEELPYATSYIPTSGGIATRVAETLEKTNISHLINSEEGVLYAEISLNGLAPNSYIQISDNSYSNRVAFINGNSATSWRAFYRVGGASQIDSTAQGLDVFVMNKIAISWKVNEFKFYVNGTKIVEDTSGSVNPANTFTRIDFSDIGNTNKFYGNIKDVRIYKTALTDQELTDLTTI